MLLILISFQHSLVSAQEYPNHPNNNHSETGEYIRKAFLDHLKKPFNSDYKFDPSYKKKVLIIGDSHAQDFLNGVIENNFLSQYQLSTRYIPTRCQIYLSNNMARYLKSSDKNLCKNSDNLLKAKAQIEQADILILVASWRKWSALALPQTIENLRLSPSQKLLIIGGKVLEKSHLKSTKISQPEIDWQLEMKLVQISLKFIKF